MRIFLYKFVYGIARVLKLFVLSILFFPAFLVSRLILPPKKSANFLRLYLQTCGGSWVKFGQILSSRLDLISLDYYEELSKLTDDITPVNYDEIKKVIEKSLNKTIEESFRQIERVPISTASIAQVHKGILHDGTVVAIKIKKPKTDEKFSVDLRILKVFTMCLETLGVLSSISIGEMTDELIYHTKRELNFNIEALNTQRFHDILKADRINHSAPRVYFNQSSDDLITMDFIDGISLRKYLSLLLNNDQEQLSILRKRGIIPEKTARIIFRSLAEQICSSGIIHADPHVGNIILTEGGCVSFIDFGNVGQLDEVNWKKLIEVFRGMSLKNTHMTFKALLSMVHEIPNRGLTQLEINIKRILSDWFLNIENPHATIQDKSNGRILLMCANEFRTNGLKLPATFLAVIRATVISDMIIFRLYPGFDPIRELDIYYADRQKASIKSSLDIRKFSHALFEIGQALKLLPGNVYNVSRWLDSDFEFLSTAYRKGLSTIDNIAVTFFQIIRFTLWIVIIAFTVNSIGKIVNLKELNLSTWFNGYSMIGVVAIIFLITQRIKSIRKS